MRKGSKHSAESKKLMSLHGAVYRRWENHTSQTREELNLKAREYRLRKGLVKHPLKERVGRTEPLKSVEYMHLKRFGGLREVVLTRDNFKCVKCGMSREEHKNIFGCDLTINHIDHQGRHSETPNNVLANLETLCIRCHGSKDATKHGRYSVYRV